MFDQFQKAVRDAYLDLVKKDKLDIGQVEPSTGKLKNWCIRTFAKGLSTADHEVFNLFFNNLKGDGDLERIVTSFDADKFRPLRNFIKGETQKPSEKDVKLLAVLIDFHPRPYKSKDWTNEQLNQKTNEQHEETISVEAEETTNSPQLGVTPIMTDGHSNGPSIPPLPFTGITPPGKINSLTKKRKLYLSAALLLVLTLLSVLFILPDKQCMCWEEDQYVEVDCEERSRQLDAIALNDYQLKNFKKINRPDTLTIKDVNRVWYSKIENEVEFFTAAGVHPIHRHKPLRAMSTHILSKYATKR